MGKTPPLRQLGTLSIRFYEVSSWIKLAAPSASGGAEP
jgi:hypothetical protein